MSNQDDDLRFLGEDIDSAELFGSADYHVVEEKKQKGRKRSNAYQKLKNGMILRMMITIAIVTVVMIFAMAYVTDGNGTAVLIVGAGVAAIVAVFFWIIFRMAGYLEDVEEGIGQVTENPGGKIKLPPELEPIQEQLNDMKVTLQKKEEEAVESEKKKNDLLMFLAHDLKTPLTSVIAYLSTLESDENLGKDERQKYTHVALVKAHRLWDLIQEFFEITRFNMQGITLEKENINLSMMLEQLADEMYGLFQEHHMTCEVHTDENIEVYADPDKLARVFDNLLRNAVNYSYPNTTIHITCREVGVWTEIIFSNRGNTIPPENLKTIFEKFYRVDDSRSSKTGGAGLGLAIAKEIVELHDGMIRAASENEETRFIVVLPEMTKEEREQKARRLERRIEEAIKKDEIRIPEQK